MKILHVCLASSYTEGMNYQDNLLPNQNVIDGHNVTIVSDCHKFENGVLVQTDAEDKFLSNGTRLVRLKYDHIINSFVSKKIRKVSPLKELIEEFSPEIILFHGVAGWEMLTVATYKKNNPHIKLYIDSHEDYNNSATNFISKWLQYKLFNKWIVKQVLPYVDKILYVSYESYTFLKELYHIPKEKMEFYPLGGIIIEPIMRKEKRSKIRKELQLNDSDILFTHSGKMSEGKRTKDLIKAFSQTENENFKLILIGSIPDYLYKEMDLLIKSDKRIQFLGWKNGNELNEYLCATDMYLQPGSQSATMQNAICCGCPVMLYPYESHEPYLKNNGYFVRTIDEKINVFKKISNNPEVLEEMSKASYKIAYELLDYKKLAARLYR